MKTQWAVGMMAIVLCNASTSAAQEKSSALPKQYAEVVLDVQGMT